jgi:hypothetical protein
MTSGCVKSQVKESPIDQRYRFLLLNQYLKNVKEVPVAGGGSKWVFCCPFCSSLARTEAKRNERKGALLWNDLQSSWVFYCVRQGSAQSGPIRSHPDGCAVAGSLHPSSISSPLMSCAKAAMPSVTDQIPFSRRLLIAMVRSMATI